MSEIVERFCQEWSAPRWDEFQSEYPGLLPGDVGIPGYFFETPIKRQPVRVLDVQDVPSYEEVRKRVIKALLGVTGEEDLEKKMQSISQRGRELRLYISEFRNLLNVYNEVVRFRDDSKVVRWFLRGLSPHLRARMQSMPGTPEEAFHFAQRAAEDAYAFGESGGRECGNAFQIHPSRRHLFNQKPERLTLFGENDKIEPNPGGDVQLLGFAAGLNEAGTEAEYLTSIAGMCGLDLDQSSVLAADRSSMAMLHGSVKTILRNATRTPEALSAITRIFPPKFLTKTPDKAESSKGEKRKHSEMEHINILEAVNKKFHALESSLRADVNAANKELLQAVQDLKGLARSSSAPDKHLVDKTCYRCRKSGHIAADCKEKIPEKTCAFCKGVDHGINDCVKLKEAVCKVCNEKGHSTAYCTPRDCRRCNTNHTPKNGCKKGLGFQNG